MIGLLKPSLEVVREAFCKCKCCYVLEICVQIQQKHKQKKGNGQYHTNKDSFVRIFVDIEQAKEK